ncbi:MAG: hypothetical protein JRI23_21755 [Deltaproteobacteria bacterium]|nr:hypothetical protein [Deltaproteobacteria bacterium]MBW2534569.1 hypothetical protein [Deltaproteobacteria bacterium]
MSVPFVRGWSARRCSAAIAAAALAVAACGGEVSEGEGGAAGATSSGTGGTTTGAGSTTTTGSGGGSAGSGGTAGAGGAGTIRCNPSEVACYAPTPACPIGEVPSVVGSCWGDCVPILSCEPEPSCATCQTGFCVEYQAWTIEYRCVMPTLQCSAAACSCMAPYFCVDPFDACSDVSSADHVVSCGCPTC